MLLRCSLSFLSTNKMWKDDSEYLFPLFICFSMESSPPTQSAPVSSVLQTSGLPESMTVGECPFWPVGLFLLDYLPVCALCTNRFCVLNHRLCKWGSVFAQLLTQSKNQGMNMQINCVNSTSYWWRLNFQTKSCLEFCRNAINDSLVKRMIIKSQIAFNYLTSTDSSLSSAEPGMHILDGLQFHHRPTPDIYSCTCVYKLFFKNTKIWNYWLSVSAEKMHSHFIGRVTCRLFDNKANCFYKKS